MVLLRAVIFFPCIPIGNVPDFHNTTIPFPHFPLFFPSYPQPHLSPPLGFPPLFITRKLLLLRPLPTSPCPALLSPQFKFLHLPRPPHTDTTTIAANPPRQPGTRSSKPCPIAGPLEPQTHLLQIYYYYNYIIIKYKNYNIKIITYYYNQTLEGHSRIHQQTHRNPPQQLLGCSSGLCYIPALQSSLIS